MGSLKVFVFLLHLSSGLGIAMDVANYIIGGGYATIKEYPYQAALYSSSDELLKCGASIVTEMALVTAGHCVDKREPSKFFVLVGATYLLDKKGIRHSIDSWITHEGLNRTHNFNEIAIILIKNKFKFDPSVSARPAKIYIGDLPVGTKVTITGFGFTDYPKSTSLSAQLKKANVEIISNDECRKKFENKTIRKILDSHLCTIDRKGKDSACFYDSGGALSWNKMLVGVVIFGVPCGEGYPDAYTKVASYADWIKEKIETVCKTRKCSKKHGHPVFVKE